MAKLEIAPSVAQMTSSITKSCPVCSDGNPVPFLDRAEVPVHQNWLGTSRDSARAVKRGRLRMACCPGCGFVFNSAFDESLLSYGPEYDNTQTASPAFDAYTDDLADGIVRAEGGAESASHVAEVGCGKGGFLLKLLSRARRWTGVGFDPTYVGELSVLDGRARFHRTFFEPGAPVGSVSVVVCRHVIEHVSSPRLLLGAIVGALRDVDSDGRVVRVFIETPDVTWILRSGVVWDMFYEHCSLFSPGSIARALHESGLGVESVNLVFGGQYMWTQGLYNAGGTGRPAAETPQRLVELAEQFGRSASRQLDRWRQLVDERRRAGLVVIWGAGAKGATLSSLLDSDASRIEALVDVSQPKQGRFVPGTGHAIVSPDSLQTLRPRTILVLNPNYMREIEARLSSLGVDADLIDLTAKSANGSHAG